MGGGGWLRAESRFFMFQVIWTRVLSLRRGVMLESYRVQRKDTRTWGSGWGLWS